MVEVELVLAHAAVEVAFNVPSTYKAIASPALFPATLADRMW